MRMRPKTLWVWILALLMGTLGVAGLVAATPAPLSGEAAAIQGIQQATDPSAVVNAYAEGFALNRNDPNLYAAYVSRMVDFGLPAMAFHQVQTLTALQPSNGLGWGVIAYVDARRADMIGAVAAIDLAGQFAPQSKFVQSTAGEILAWYDVKADKSKVPKSAKAGLVRIRALLGHDTPFTQAYNTAKEAYQARASGTVPPAATAEPATPSGYATATTATPYYVDYYYDWGPGWIEPAPWCWWEPLGVWYGFDFFPQFPVVVFNNRGFFEHHHYYRGELFEHEDGFEHHEFVEHHHAFFHHDWDNPAAWHRGAHGHAAFFGLPARPAPTATRLARENFSHEPNAITSFGRVAPSPIGVAPGLTRQSHPAGSGLARHFHGLGPLGAGSHGAESLMHPELGFHNRVAHENFAARRHVRSTLPHVVTRGERPHSVAGSEFHNRFAGGAFHNGIHGLPMGSGSHHNFAEGQMHHGVAGGAFRNGIHGLPMGGGFHHSFTEGESHNEFAGGGFHGSVHRAAPESEVHHEFAGGGFHNHFAGSDSHHEFGAGSLPSRTLRGGFHSGFAGNGSRGRFAGGGFHGGFHGGSRGDGFHGGFRGGGFHGGGGHR